MLSLEDVINKLDFNKSHTLPRAYKAKYISLVLFDSLWRLERTKLAKTFLGVYLILAFVIGIATKDNQLWAYVYDFFSIQSGWIESKLAVQSLTLLTGLFLVSYFILTRMIERELSPTGDELLIKNNEPGRLQKLLFIMHSLRMGTLEARVNDKKLLQPNWHELTSIRQEFWQRNSVLIYLFFNKSSFIANDVGKYDARDFFFDSEDEIIKTTLSHPEEKISRALDSIRILFIEKDLLNESVELDAISYLIQLDRTISDTTRRILFNGVGVIETLRKITSEDGAHFEAKPMALKIQDQLIDAEKLGFETIRKILAINPSSPFWKNLDKLAKNTSEKSW